MLVWAVFLKSYADLILQRFMHSIMHSHIGFGVHVVFMIVDLCGMERMMEANDRNAMNRFCGMPVLIAAMVSSLSRAHGQHYLHEYILTPALNMSEHLLVLGLEYSVTESWRMRIPNITGESGLVRTFTRTQGLQS